jgi:hypothetical protein
MQRQYLVGGIRWWRSRAATDKAVVGGVGNACSTVLEVWAGLPVLDFDGSADNLSSPPEYTYILAPVGTLAVALRHGKDAGGSQSEESKVLEQGSHGRCSSMI